MFHAYQQRYTFYTREIIMTVIYEILTNILITRTPDIILSIIIILIMGLYSIASTELRLLIRRGGQSLSVVFNMKIINELRRNNYANT